MGRERYADGQGVARSASQYTHEEPTEGDASGRRARQNDGRPAPGERGTRSEPNRSFRSFVFCAQALLEGGEGADAVCVVDEQELNVHSLILCARSEVFKAQLYTLTMVPMERQKIMGVKGGTVKVRRPTRAAAISLPPKDGAG